MIERRHATCVAIRGQAVLIEGPSGAGKSDLALRLIDRGAVLVSDDQTLLAVRDGRLISHAPETIRSRIEVRGLGILPVDTVAEAPVALLVRLGGPVERMPEDAQTLIAGIAVPSVALNGYEASAPVKVELALNRVTTR